MSRLLPSSVWLTAFCFCLSSNWFYLFFCTSSTVFNNTTENPPKPICHWTNVVYFLVHFFISVSQKPKNSKSIRSVSAGTTHCMVKKCQKDQAYRFKLKLFCLQNYMAHILCLCLSEQFFARESVVKEASLSLRLNVLGARLGLKFY